MRKAPESEDDEEDLSFRRPWGSTPCASKASAPGCPKIKAAGCPGMHILQISRAMRRYIAALGALCRVSTPMRHVEALCRVSTLMRLSKQVRVRTAQEDLRAPLSSFEPVAAFAAALSRTTPRTLAAPEPVSAATYLRLRAAREPGRDAKHLLIK